MKRNLLILVLFLTLFLIGCAGALNEEIDTGTIISVEGGEYTNITAPKLQLMLETKDFTFINVHVPFSGDIPGTDLSIPFDAIEENQNYLPVDKDAKIVIYCRSGSMSGVSAQELVRLGYTNIWNLEGGFNAWERAGLTLEGN
jgi:rhodanese-related sulfurtransferase